MRVLFLIGALYAAGETRVALGFAESLRTHGDEVFFVSSALSAELVGEKGFPQLVLGEDKQKNSAQFLDWIRRLSPDVVVVADYYLFMTQDLEAIFDFDHLASLQAPVLTLDNVGLSPDEQVLSWSAFGVSYVIKPLPEFIQGVIRPCPPQDPSIPRQRTFYTKVHDERGLPTAEAARAVRREIGCDDTDKIIFYTLPRWTYRLAARTPLTYAYHVFLGKILTHYFESLGQTVHFVCLSPRQLIRSNNGRVQVHRLKPEAGRKLLPEDRYRAFIAAADLLISDSVLSATLGLALLCGVPAISLMNSVTVAEAESGPQAIAPFALTPWARDTALAMHRMAPGSVFPFAWFPFGFLEEIERLHRGSAYLGAMERCELFDEIGATATMRNLLFDSSTQAELSERQQRYAHTVASLPSFPELLRRVL